MSNATQTSKNPPLTGPAKQSERNKSIPEATIQLIKRTAQKQITKAEKTGDAIRRLDLQQLAPLAYKEVVKWTASDLRTRFDSRLPRNSISIPIPLSCDHDCELKIHAPTDLRKPSIFIEFGSRW